MLMLCSACKTPYLSCVAAGGLRRLSSKISYQSPQQIKHVRSTLKYVTLEKDGTWRSHANMVCCTLDQPLRRLVLGVRTSFTYADAKVAARMRDAALLAMTNGRCNAESAGCPGLILIRCSIPQPYPSCSLRFYAQQHVFLCRNDFLDRVSRPKSTSAFREAVAFGAGDSAGNDAAPVPPASARQVNLRQFGNMLMKSDRNIMLNAPAGYGKSHIIKTVMLPYLQRRYKKKGVWLTASTGNAALALGVGATTLHSMAGIGLGVGTAADIHRAMPNKARKRWQDVKVSMFYSSGRCCQSVSCRFQICLWQC